MLKMIIFIAIVFLPWGISNGEENKLPNSHEHAPLTQERLESVAGMRGVQNFQEVIELLELEKFQEARDLLSKRIEALNRAFENKWVVSDKQPQIIDCLLLRFMINILQNNIKDAEADCSLTGKFNPKYGDTLREGIPEFIKDAKETPDEFKYMIKESARMMWLSKDMPIKDKKAK